MNSSCTCGGGSGLLRNERWSVRSVATDDEATRMYGDWLDSLQSIALSAAAWSAVITYVRPLLAVAVQAVLTLL